MSDRVLLQIGGKRYDVDICNSEQKYHDSRAGWCCPDQQTIVIDETKPKETQLECIIHESLELINNRYDLQMSHQSIARLGECLFQLLPQLRKFEEPPQ